MKRVKFSNTLPNWLDPEPVTGCAQVNRLLNPWRGVSWGSSPIRFGWAAIFALFIAGSAAANGEYADQGLIFNETPQLFFCQIRVDAAPKEFQAFDATEKQGYFYLDFHGLPETGALNLDFKSRYIRHIKRLYYPDQKVVRYIFYTHNPPKIELERQSDRTYVVRVQSGQGQSNSMRLNNGGSRRLIVIDPGHGGVQSGARSRQRIKGRYLEEKDLTLKISQKLYELCAKSPNLTPYMTRMDDRTLSLRERIDLAVAAEGDLFLSIHLNASSNPNARGFEIYYLSERGQAQTAHDTLLKLENDMIEQNDDAITRDWLQEILEEYNSDNIRALRNESRKLAEAIDIGFHEAGPFRRDHRGVKHGAFRVLKNEKMPAILIECGFLTNERDANALIEENIQTQMAALIYNGLNRYLAATDPSFSPQWAQ